MKKELIVILLKVLSYAISLFLASFCVTALASCSISHTFDAYGKSVIISTDTTFINHKGYSHFPRK